jgi:hypothetical protein
MCKLGLDIATNEPLEDPNKLMNLARAKLRLFKATHCSGFWNKKVFSRTWDQEESDNDQSCRPHKPAL